MSRAAPLQTQALQASSCSRATATRWLPRECTCGSPTASLTGACTECKPKQGWQAKLALGAINDPLDRETDQIADQVMATTTHAAGNVAPADIQERFGHDFSRVRVNTDANADQSAREMSAAAHANAHSNLNRGLYRVSPLRAVTGEPGSDSPKVTAVMPGQAEDSVPTSEKLPGLPSACVMQAAMPYSRSGIIRTPFGSVTEDFEVRVEWSSATHRGEESYCAAECGEYHQFLKGYMRSSPNQDGSDLKDVSGTIFGGKALDPNVFQEDGLDRNPHARYGHRKERQTMNENYEPDRATGTKYVGKDSPGVHIGTFADFDLTFVGKLVDTCNGTETVSAPWRVFYRGVIRP